MKKKFYVTILSAVIAIGIGIWLDTNSENQYDKSVNSNNYATDNKGIGWGLKKIKNCEPEVTQQQKDVLNQYNSFYIDPKRPKKLYLTFDEGYENGYTSQILDILKEKQVPAAFFITGPYAKKEQELVRRMIDEGHIIGNHTVNHPNLPKLGSGEAIAKELTEMNDLVKELYSYDMTYMRPPEGEYSPLVLSVADSLGLKTVFWSFAYKDWDVNSQNGKDYAFRSVTEYLHNGAVLLLHAVSKDNTEALKDIIVYAKNTGYTFASLDDIKVN